MTIQVLVCRADGTQIVEEREVDDAWLQPAAAVGTTETPESGK